jgi:hypothetical protein
MDDASVLPVEVTGSSPPPRPPRSRAVSRVAAAMLIAGAGGIGFGLGRAASPSDDSVADAPEPTPTTEAAVPAITTAPEPTTSSAPADTGDVDSSNAVPTTVAVGSDSDAAPEGAEHQLVWEQTTEDGVRVRVLLGPGLPTSMPGDYGVPGWAPAPFCWGTREMRVTVDGPDVVDVSYGQWFDEIYGGIAIPLLADVGWADGRPLRVVVVQLDGEVDEVAIRWDDGVTARSDVVDGLAVLLAPGTESWSHPYELDVAGPAGTSTVSQADLDRSADPAWREACNPPPPSLPDPGEQPADPDAERAAITERFAILWDQDTPPEDKPEVLDDRTGVDDAVAAVYEGGFAATARTAVHRIDEIVFTAPTTAWFRYGIDTDTGYFGDRYGVATLTADGWIFPRALICQDLALAGGQCEPIAETIYPPSWYEQFGEQCVYDAESPDGRCFGFDASEIAAWP